MRDRVVRWSVDEYERLVGQGAFRKNAELIRGLVIERRSKSPLHFAIAKWLYDRLLTLVPDGFIARLEGPLRLADSEPEPDLAIVRGDERAFRDHHPTTAELVVEVAVTSVAIDRENASLYAEAGVQEYWIVLAQEKQVEVYRRPVQGVYLEKAVYRLGDVLTCASLPAIRISLTDLFG